MIRNRYRLSSVADEQSVGGVVTDDSYSTSFLHCLLRIAHFELYKLGEAETHLLSFRSSTRLYSEHELLLKGV